MTAWQHMLATCNLQKEIVEEAQALRAVITAQHAGIFCQQQVFLSDGQGDMQGLGHIAGRQCRAKPIFTLHHTPHTLTYLQPQL